MNIQMKMKKSLLFIVLPGFLTGPPLLAQHDQAARRGTAKAASELSAMAREIRVSRRAREQLEDHARIVEYAVRHEQLNPAEMRRIKNQLAQIEKTLERVEKKGSMSVNEAQSLQRDLSRAYRTIWVLRRNKLDKGQKIIFLGRQIVLREEYRKKFEAGSLNQQEMKDILHAYYSACRVREQLRTDSLKAKHRARLERECFEILSEYFTLAESAETAQKPGKK